VALERVLPGTPHAEVEPRLEAAARPQVEEQEGALEAAPVAVGREGGEEADGDAV
jgi:hypothetical protein